MATNVVERTAITEPLDGFLLSVIQTIQTAVSQGTKQVTDDPAAADKAINDCKEIIEVIMQGNVKEWVS
jgi:hypothetical protein